MAKEAGYMPKEAGKDAERGRKKRRRFSQPQGGAAGAERTAERTPE